MAIPSSENSWMSQASSRPMTPSLLPFSDQCATENRTRSLLFLMTA
jgi:hypothetical protein